MPSKLPPKPKPPHLTARERWNAALAQQRQEREEIRNKKLHGTPLAKTSSTPIGDHMVRRGTRVIALSRAQASETTRKSWRKRKEKYGKKGRVSGLTFHKSHRKVNV